MESVFTHTPPSPWHDKDNCASPPPLLPPPPQWSYPIGALRNLSVGPLWWSQFGGYEYMNWYWTVMVIAFCFYHFLIGCLWAEILTAIVWRNSVKSWQAPIFCPCQYLWRFLHGRPLQCGRESAHKSRAASGNNTLGDCTWRVQHLLGEVGEHQGGLGEVSCCGLCQAKTVRRCLCASTNILSIPILFLRQYFVNVNILSTPIFFRSQSFVDANNLLTPLFCRRQ